MRGNRRDVSARGSGRKGSGALRAGGTGRPAGPARSPDRAYEPPRILRSWREEELLRETGDVFLGTGSPFKPGPGPETPPVPQPE